MALLNLILFALFTVLGRFFPDGGDAGGDGGGAAATPGTTTPPATGSGDAGAASTGDAGTPPATTVGGDEPLGEGGKRALEAERAARKAAEQRAKALETERDTLKTATQSEQEKAIDAAKKAAAAEERTKWEGRTLRAESKGALAAAGAADVDVAIAAFLDQHPDLKVTESGDVEDLDATVKAFKQKHPTLFTARVPGGSADQGAKPPTDKRAASLEEAYERHYAPQRTQ